MKKWYLLLLLSCQLAFAGSSQMAKVSERFEKLKRDPSELMLFLADMPKGADLHIHLDGAVYAENLVRFADPSLCFNPKTMAAFKADACDHALLLHQLPEQNVSLYNALIDAWSVRDFVEVTQSGHDHVFQSFVKFAPAYRAHVGEVLGSVVNRAGAEHEDYLELIYPFAHDRSIEIGKNIDVDANADFAAMQKALMDKDIQSVVSELSKQLDDNLATMGSTLQCGTDRAKPGCRVTVRAIYPVIRGMEPKAVFAQLLTGFMLADSDPRVLGVNMVMPEDGHIVLRDYHLQMQMVKYFHKAFPNVHISLHAGELAKGLVPSKDLRFHIREAVDIAGAERIGHGVDIMYEDNATQLLHEMAQKQVDVEINLTSNDKILDLRGEAHPFMLYRRYHVPVTLSTDDEGVFRTDLEQELQRAVLTYHLTYPELKNIIRNSITFSFLPGESVWESPFTAKQVAVCRGDNLRGQQLSGACQAFINQSQKATMQWRLEKEFEVFEHANMRRRKVFNLAPYKMFREQSTLGSQK